MAGASSSKSESVDLTELYYTSIHLSVFESVLDDAMAVLKRRGEFGEDDDARSALRLRLAAAIMRFANIGERDPAVLLRWAVLSSTEGRVDPAQPPLSS